MGKHRDRRPKQESFDDRILLRIRRDFTSDEAVRFVLQENDKLKSKLAETQIKFGAQKSYTDELEYQTERLQLRIELLEKRVKELEYENLNTFPSAVTNLNDTLHPIKTSA